LQIIVCAKLHNLCIDHWLIVHGRSAVELDDIVPELSNTVNMLGGLNDREVLQFLNNNGFSHRNLPQNIPQNHVRALFIKQIHDHGVQMLRDDNYVHPYFRLFSDDDNV
jgi:hypothetical protein